MSSNKDNIEKRLENMKNIYLKLDKICDNIPDAIPNEAVKIVKDKILSDKDLKELIDGLDSHRPPRIFMMGRTGVGKSSLINALFKRYVAKVSHTESCTENVTMHQYRENDEIKMEIMDTRGIAESEKIGNESSAEDMLLNDIMEFSPDVALFVLSCTHRDDVDKDVEFMKKIVSKYEQINQLKLPVVVVVNKCDEMAPSYLKKKDEYNETKIENIRGIVSNYKGIIVNKGLKIEGIIGVSSLIGWKTRDGAEIDVDKIENLPEEDLVNLQISFDGRYNIDKLFEIIEKAIIDFDAKMGLKMSFRLEEVIRKVANKLTYIFAGISSTIALSPIPISDIYLLLMLQAVLVTMIAALSGRDISLNSAKEFIFSLGGIAGIGYGFKIAAQQAVKLIPGAGSAISSTVAFAGTVSIGKAAIRYYIENSTLEQIKEDL